MDCKGIKKHWIHDEVGRQRFKRTIDLAARMLINGQKLNFDVLGQVYRPDQKIPAATVIRLFRNEVTKTALNDKIIEILAKQGVTEDFVIDKRKKAIEIAEEKQRPDWIDTHISAFEDMLEMKPKKQTNTISETRQITYSDVDKAIQATERKEIKSDLNHSETEKVPQNAHSDVNKGNVDDE